MRAFGGVFALVALAASAPVDEREKRQLGTYDYIVIGVSTPCSSAFHQEDVEGNKLTSSQGGTAGLAIADRLSEDENVQVAVIEPGASHQLASPILSTTPAGDVVFVGGSPTDQNMLVDWNFMTVPQKGANGRSLSYTRGRCLGGR